MHRNEFVEYIIGDQLAQISGMSARAMFGGFGIYEKGTIVGIVIDDELYLKVDATNQAAYEAMGSAAFHYLRKGGKDTTMSYWKVPPEIIEDREKLAALVEQSYEINLRKALAVKPRTKKKPPKQ